MTQNTILLFRISADQVQKGFISLHNSNFRIMIPTVTVHKIIMQRLYLRSEQSQNLYKHPNKQLYCDSAIIIATASNTDPNNKVQD